MERFGTKREARDGFVGDAVRTAQVAATWAWEGLVALLRGVRREAPAPGGGGEGRRPPADALRPGGVATLRELGVPGSLAADLEECLDLMGAARPDGRIEGFRFRTPDGVSHRLRSSAAAGAARKGGRAA